MIRTYAVAAFTVALLAACAGQSRVRPTAPPRDSSVELVLDVSSRGEVSVGPRRVTLPELRDYVLESDLGVIRAVGHLELVEIACLWEISRQTGVTFWYQREGDEPARITLEPRNPKSEVDPEPIAQRCGLL